MPTRHRQRCRALTEQRMGGQTGDAYAAASTSDRDAAYSIPGQVRRGGEGRKPVQGPGDDRPKTRKKPAVRRGPMPRVTGQQTQEAQMASVVTEQGHGHAVGEARREQVLPPGTRLGERYR